MFVKIHKHFNPCSADPGVAFENSVDPDQMASEEAIWSGSTLFFIQFVNLYEQTTLSFLIGWQSETSVANLIYSAGISVNNIALKYI